MLALTETLVSPVSWTHHWSWLVWSRSWRSALWSVHRQVAVALLVLLGLAVAAPYLWLQPGPLAFVDHQLTGAGGGGGPGLWLVAEDRRRRASLRGGGGPDADGAAARPGPGGMRGRHLPAGGSSLQ